MLKSTKFWFEARNSEESTIVDNAFGGEGGFQWGVARAFLDKRDNILPYKGMYLSYAFDYNGETEDLAAYFENLYDLRYFQKISASDTYLFMFMASFIESILKCDSVLRESCEFCTKSCHGRVLR